MNRGELFTKLAVWMAVGAYAIGAALMLGAGRRSNLLIGARWAWTFGCIAFIAHVVCAFSFFHRWSHAAAYRETASQTAAMTGLHWGGGLYLNYLFVAAWLTDVLWWWTASVNFEHRPRWLTLALHGFFFFMVFNGAVVFAHGPMRWLGAVVCAGLFVLWALTRRDRLPTKD